MPVGIDPSCITIDRNNTAYVSNSASGTVSVIPLRGRGRFSVTQEIKVGSEPQGCALSQNGRNLYIANYTEGTVSIIDTTQNVVIDKVNVGGKPAAIIVSDDHNQETVYITEFYAELISGGSGEGFDDGKRGDVHSFPVNNPALLSKITLSPLANSGFTVDRTAFYQATNANVNSEIFCPDLSNVNPELNTKDIQAVYPNQLFSGVNINSKTKNNDK